MRRIVDAMLYLLRGGLPWRMVPPGFPPATTVQRKRRLAAASHRLH